jgi:hypothetical protein
VIAVVVYNLTSSMVPNSARVEGTGAATVLEVVEGNSAPPPEALGGSAGKREEARGSLIAAQARERRARDERKLMDRMWETMISSAMGGGGGGGGSKPSDGGGGGGGGSGDGIIAGELDALASTGWNSLETLMQRRRQALSRWGLYKLNPVESSWFQQLNVESIK